MCKSTVFAIITQRRCSLCSPVSQSEKTESMLSFSAFFNHGLSGGGGGRGGLVIRLSTSSVIISNSSSADLKTPTHFIVDYLISKFGFSSEGAIKASKRLSHIKSLDKPESFVGFMRSQGFNDAHIKKIVTRRPVSLLMDVDRTLAPKIQAFKDIGFSGPNLIHLLVSNSQILELKLDPVLSRIQFWQGLLGSRDHLIRIIKNNNNFLGRSIEECVMPNLSFLRSCGVPDEKISMVVRRCPRFIIQGPQSLIAAGNRAEKEMGVARSSGMFLWALWALHHVSNKKFIANMEFMKSFGWSEADFLSAFRKAPLFLCSSTRMLARKMEFLLKEAGCMPSDVARRPVILMCSLEKKLIPRHHVMKILMSRGLLNRELKVATLMSYSEKGFMDKFVFPHAHKIPELQEIYVDGCGKGARK